MKRVFSLCLALLMILSSAFVLFSCTEPEEPEINEEELDLTYSDSVDWEKFKGMGMEVNVYNWGEYISIDDGEECFFDTNREFEKLTGIKVLYTNFATNEEMYAKIKSGGTAYDVIIPSEYMISRMINEGMLEKLDFSNIPNFSYIKEDLVNPDYDPTNEYSVPYMWGVVGIVYNTMKVYPEDNVNTWDILWDEKYEGNIFMFSNSRDTFGIALKRLGYSYNTTNEDEIRAAAESLAEQKELVQAYVMDEIFDKMGGGEAALAPYYAGDALTMMEDNPDLAFAVPEEGTNFYVDAMCIPKGAPHKEAAEMYINFMCETLVALKNCEYVMYSTPHTEAFKYLDEEVRNSISYPSDDIMEKAEAYTALPLDTTKLVDSLWTDLMSSGNTNPYTVPLFLIICLTLAVVINVYKRKKKKKILLELEEGTDK